MSLIPGWGPKIPHVVQYGPKVKKKKKKRRKKEIVILHFSLFFQSFTPLGVKKCYLFLPHCCHCCLVSKVASNSCNPMDGSLPVSSVHGTPQARILGWVATSFSRGSSWPGNQGHISCIGRRVLYPEPAGSPPHLTLSSLCTYNVAYK